MSPTFASFGPHIASSRYRASIPARELACRDIWPGKDWLVIGKHGWEWERVAVGYRKVCFDVCDDHFNDQHAEHYLSCINRADLVTCNSPEMARLIFSHTGRVATVIPDPYEQPEKEPHIGESLLWFGHRSNLPDLMLWLEVLPPVRVITGPAPCSFEEWSPALMNEAFDSAGLVVLPVGAKKAKSGNRAIEAIRRGLFVVAGDLPAYSDLGVWVGDIKAGVEWALSHKDEAIQRIRASQAYVEKEYSPQRIADLWIAALEGAQ